MKEEELNILANKIASILLPKIEKSIRNSNKEYISEHDLLRLPDLSRTVAKNWIEKGLLRKYERSNGREYYSMKEVRGLMDREQDLPFRTRANKGKSSVLTKILEYSKSTKQ